MFIKSIILLLARLSDKSDTQLYATSGMNAYVT